ncbi:hypothetical protein B0H14DRAFT_3858665 [Mycena olivaceomarginata]|nr:hypothetical protein B0H14DRAFT_3858665 [Mycena olivaceomarginata]
MRMGGGTADAAVDTDTRTREELESNAVPTSVPVSASTSTSIALQARCVYIFFPFVCAHLWFRLRSSFVPFFPSFLWLVGMGLAAVLARCR